MNGAVPARFSPMRPVKRFLVFASELGVLVVGVIVSLALGASFFGYLGDSWAQAAFCSGLLATVAGFVALRHKTRPWKIEYDAVGWAARRAERKLHPIRSKYKRIAGRTLLCVPSAVALLVLLFLPVASHMMHPGPRYLGHYRVSIPWTLTAMSVPGVPADDFVIAFALIGSDGSLA